MWMRYPAADDVRRWVALDPIQRTDESRLRWIANDKRIWRFNAAGDATTPDGLSAWMTAALDGCDDRRQETFAIRDQRIGVVAGSSRIGNIDRQAGSCEIGWTWVGTGWWGSALNTAAKLAMLTHAFNDETRNRVFFNVDARNRRSARAMRKLGARLEGVRRFDRQCCDGHVRSTLIFSVLRTEWAWIHARLLERLRRFESLTESQNKDALRRAIASRWCSIVPVDPSITHELRHAVLRPTEDRSVVDYPEDQALPSWHLGLIALGQCVGVLSLYEESNELVEAKKAWRLRGMAVAEHLQGLGLGGHLMQAATTLALSHDVDKIWCNARQPSFSFYERWQFEPVGDLFTCATREPHRLMIGTPGGKDSETGGDVLLP